MKKITVSVLCGLSILISSSCVPLAVGATAGYVASENGYKVRNPIVKEESTEPAPYPGY